MRVNTLLNILAVVFAVFVLICLLADSSEAAEIYEYKDGYGTISFSDREPQGVNFRVRDTDKIPLRQTVVQKYANLDGLWTISYGEQNSPPIPDAPAKVLIRKERRQFGDYNKQVWVYYEYGREIAFSENLAILKVIINLKNDN